MATSSVNFVSSLGAGSGIDTKSLAENLVEAERAPRKNLIDGKIKKEEAHITGYGAVKSLLTTLQSALGKLNDVSDFTSLAPSVSQPAAFAVSTSPTAQATSYDIDVTQIAKATRLATNSFSSTSLSLGSSFDLSFVKKSDRQTEQQTVQFMDLAANETVTVGGLTLTATTDMTAAEVASAFKDSTTVTSGDAFSFSGSLSSEWTLGALSGDALTLTSSTAYTDVAEVSVSASAADSLPTITSVDGNDGLSSAASVTVTSATPQGIMNAVNAKTSVTGVSAQMIKTGSGYSLVFTGVTGADNDFVVSGLPSALSMRSSPLQTAQDAMLSINGLDITSSTNQLTDNIDGVTLNLYAPTQGAAQLDLNRQTNTLKQNIAALVSAYNDFNAGLKELGDSKSKLEQFGGTLAGDSLVNTLRNQVRAMFSKDGNVYPDGDDTQASLNPDVNAAWQVGISFDRYGTMTFDESKFDQAVTEHFDQTVLFFTANAQGQSVYSRAPGGVAGDAYKKIDKILRSTGIIAQSTDSANTRIKQYNDQLTKLEDRMAMLLSSYQKQFSAMDNLVGESNSTRTNLKSSFDGLMAMYTKN